MYSELTQEILNLKPGDHLCLFYEKDPAEQMPALIPFIQEGLSADEQFIYIADDQTIEELAERLRHSGVNVGQECDRGALKLWTRQQWRQPGELVSEFKSRQVRQLIDEAVQSGFKGSRFAVEMTWALGPNINADQLEHWEATINTIFVPGFASRIACQYNRSRLAPEVILAALHTHPLAILGDHVYSNFFYEAPLILEGNSKSIVARLDWMIGELKRARAMDNERQKLEAQLRQAQKMESIGTLAGGIAHDFNNILNIIKGYSTVLSEEFSANVEAAEKFKIIDEAVERGSAMVRQLLSMAHKTETHFAPTCVNRVVTELAQLIQQTFPKSVEVALQLEPEVPNIMADANQINQVLLNLCVNARDAMPNGGRLSLSTAVVDGSSVHARHYEAGAKNYMCIEITDTGTGIDPSIQSRIFEPFFTTKEPSRGTGLGLAMAYGITKKHQGFIDVESEVGRGTTFRLYLPISITTEKAGDDHEGNGRAQRN